MHDNSLLERDLIQSRWEEMAGSRRGDRDAEEKQTPGAHGRQ
jgi:hypothetical protein